MEPSGTNQMAMPEAWMKNKIISSAYSALRNVLNTGTENSNPAEKQKPGGDYVVGRK